MILPNSRRIGSCVCGAPIEQVQFDPAFLKDRAPGTVDLLRRESQEDSDGNLFTPRYCQEHITRRGI